MATSRRAVPLVVVLVAALALLLLQRPGVLSIASVANGREPGSDQPAAASRAAASVRVSRGMPVQSDAALHCHGALGVAVSADGLSVYAVTPGSALGGMSDRSAVASVIGWRRNGTGLCCREVINDSEHLHGARDVVVSADGRSVYVASGLAGCITQFDRDLQTGALSNQVNHVDHTNLDGAYGVAVSDDGANVYAVAQLSDTLVTWDRNIETGVLRNMRVHADPVGLDGACSITVSADGASVLVSAINADAVVVFERLLPTGDLYNPVAHVLANVCSVAVSRDGASVYAAAYGSESAARWMRDPISKMLSNPTVLRDPVAVRHALDVKVGPIDGLALYTAAFRSSAIVSYSHDPASGRINSQVLQVNANRTSSPWAVAIEGTSIFVVADGPTTIVGFDRGPREPEQGRMGNESLGTFPFADVDPTGSTLPAGEAAGNHVDIGVDIGDADETLLSTDTGGSDSDDGAAVGWIIFAVAMALLLIGVVMSTGFVLLSRKRAQSENPASRKAGVDADGGLESRHQSRNYNNGPSRRATHSPPLSRLPSSPVLLQNLSAPLTIPNSPQRIIEVASLGPPTKSPNSIVRDLTVSNPHRRSSLINGPSVSRISERSVEGYELGDDTEI